MSSGPAQLQVSYISAGSFQFFGSSVYFTLPCGSASGLPVSSSALVSRTAEPLTPRWHVDQSAPPWLLAPSAPHGSVVLTAPPGLPRPSGYALDSCRSAWPSRPSAALCPSTPLAPSGSTLVLSPTGYALVLWHPGFT